jgi:hypothetical protein
MNQKTNQTQADHPREPVGKRAPGSKPDNPERYLRFEEAAREQGADESPDAMDKAFERVVKPKRSPPKEPKSSARDG